MLENFIDKPENVKRREFLKVSLAALLTYAFRGLKSSVSFIEHGDRESNKVALTFDDGWIQPPIERLINICDQYDIKVSIFPVASTFQYFHESYDKAYNHGHPLYNHTLTHGNLGGNTSDDFYKKQILGWEKEYERHLSVALPETRILRPPGFYGINTPELYNWLAVNGYEGVIYKSLSSGDSSGKMTTVKIEERIKKLMKGGDIVLFHLLTKTMDALPRIIEDGFRKGLEFVTLTELPGTPIYRPPEEEIYTPSSQEKQDIRDVLLVPQSTQQPTQTTEEKAIPRVSPDLLFRYRNFIIK